MSVQTDGGADVSRAGSDLSFPALFRGVPEKQRAAVVAGFRRAGGVVSEWPGRWVATMHAAAFDVENAEETAVAARGRGRAWESVAALHRARLRLEAAMGW